MRPHKRKYLVKALKKVLSLYSNRGLDVQSILMDREFEYLEGASETQINTTGSDEHVPKIERRNRGIKETFAQHGAMPYI